MGCISSKEVSSQNTRSGQTRDVKQQGAKPGKKGVRDDFTDVAPTLKENEIEDEVTFSLEELPRYEIGENASAQIILETVRTVHRKRALGINGSFNVIRERNYHVWIEANHQHAKGTRTAIEFQAMLLLQLSKAMHGNMIFFFTNFPNLDSNDLGDEDRELMFQLTRVWNSSSWAMAKNIVTRKEILSDLADWMKAEDKFKSNRASEMPPDEKHVILLSHVRDLMLPFWHGWRQQDIMDIGHLQLLCRSAKEAAREQPKCLNSICNTYLREINMYLRLRTLKLAHPVTCLFLIGSMLQSREVKTIQDHQEVDANLKRRLTTHPLMYWKLGGASSEDKIDAAGRRDLPFQITAMVDIERMSVDGVKGFKAIDDIFQGDDDINDIKMYKHTMFLKYFFSSHALFTFFNGHNKDVDDVEISQEDMYGDVSLTSPVDKKISIPHVTEFMKIFGMDVNDWVPRKIKIRIPDYSDTEHLSFVEMYPN